VARRGTDEADNRGVNHDRIPTAPLAATGLIAGFGVAVASGSRPLGGVVLAGCGLACMAVWWRRDGPRTSLALGATGLVAFALSHVLAKAIGAWPSVLAMAAVTAALCWRYSDSRRATLPVPPSSSSRLPQGSSV
jgi:hypothetical protein